jgi:hypothetical protein
MSFEDPENGPEQKEQVFENLWENAPKEGEFIEVPEPYAKHEFLEYLVKHKNVLIHGSNWDVEELEPRQANDKSKKFGNQKAVYATTDHITPFFYAIRDKERYRGSGLVSSYGDPQKGNLSYTFKVEEKMLEEKPWSDGIVYILSRDAFAQGVDDEGKKSREFASSDPVEPLAKLRVSPEDFPFLDHIEVYQKS